MEWDSISLSNIFLVGIVWDCYWNLRENTEDYLLGEGYEHLFSYPVHPLCCHARVSLLDFSTFSPPLVLHAFLLLPPSFPFSFCHSILPYSLFLPCSEEMQMAVLQATYVTNNTKAPAAFYQCADIMIVKM